MCSVRLSIPVIVIAFVENSAPKKKERERKGREKREREREKENGY